MSITLSEGQRFAEEKILLWWNSGKPVTPYFYLAGYAGTGKTSIAKHLVEKIKAIYDAENDQEESKFVDEEEETSSSFRCAFVAFTGKASLILASKNCKPSSTIHRLIYTRIYDEKTKTYFFEKRQKIDKRLKLLIIDECSMVNSIIGNDILSFNVPILVLGDPGQLPPVEGAGFFTSREPDHQLTEIHRQAAESPILQLATQARNNEILPFGTKKNDLSTSAILVNAPAVKTFLQADIVLCGTNSTRTNLNSLFRQHLFYNTILPQVGEKLICLKNNWDVDNMMNGSLWRVESIKELKHEKPINRIHLELTDWENPTSTINVVTHKCFFDKNIPSPQTTFEWKNVTHFTFGYAITVHKAQGSEWKNVIIADEASKFREDKAKWLYTAITRASQNLIIYQP